MDLTTLAAGPIGAALGFAGNIATKWIGMKEAKQNHEFKLAEMELASKVDLQKADIMFRQTVEEKAGEALTAAVNAQAASQPASPWARDILALFRPGLTAYLMIVSAVLAILFRHSKPDLLEYIITSMFTMSSVACGFWFGSREAQKMDIRAAVRK
jgi:hypothetical protein